jgi:hypothetical protein
MRALQMDGSTTLLHDQTRARPLCEGRRPSSDTYPALAFTTALFRNTGLSHVSPGARSLRRAAPPSRACASPAPSSSLLSPLSPSLPPLGLSRWPTHNRSASRPVASCFGRQQQGTARPFSSSRLRCRPSTEPTRSPPSARSLSGSPSLLPPSAFLHRRSCSLVSFFTLARPPCTRPDAAELTAGSLSSVPVLGVLLLPTAGACVLSELLPPLAPRPASQLLTAVLRSSTSTLLLCHWPCLRPARPD